MTMRKIAIVLALSLGMTTYAFPCIQSPSPNHTTDSFFVFGAVNKPGRVYFEEGISFRKVIPIVQGTKYPSNKCRVLIFREDTASGQWQEINVEIAEIMSGRKEDIPILPNDIIIVIESN